MIRRALRIAIAQDRRSAAAALGLALAAILFAQIVVPGSAWLLTGAHARPSLERPASP